MSAAWSPRKSRTQPDAKPRMARTAPQSGPRGRSPLPAPGSPSSPPAALLPPRRSTGGLATPSTAADSVESLEGSAPATPATEGSEDGLSSGVSLSSFNASLQLASAGAAPCYVRQAQSILDEGEFALAAVLGTPSFAEAMSRQGVETQELRAGSKLSVRRRAALLAAVLQEQDALRAAAAPAAAGAKVLRRRLQQRHKEAVEHLRVHWEHRQQVAQQQEERCQEQRARNEEKAVAEEEHAQRVQAREELEAQRRVERCELRDGRWLATVARGEAERLERATEQREVLAFREERSSQCLECRDEARELKKQGLRKRFEMVSEAGQQAQREAAMKTQQQGERLEMLLKRSEEHLKAHHQVLELKQQESREKAEEREHQVLRVSRMRLHQRFERIAEVSEDSAVFEECGQLRQAMYLQLSLLSSQEPLGLPPPSPANASAGGEPVQDL